MKKNLKKSIEKIAKKYLKPAVFLGKILALMVLAVFTWGLFFCKNMGQLTVGIVITIFITMPIIFIFFFEDKSCKKYPHVAKYFDILRNVCTTVTLLFLATVAVRFIGAIFGII